VTGSRLHAVRYKLAFDAYIKGKGYTDVKSLVAFSGTILDDGIEYTEVSMNNGIKETELPEAFATEEYQVLLVAEKYQTGFDQPLLHTMYVDKKLSGIQAVQTLSRLNRTAAGKEDTFVLDFVNSPEDIFEAFKPYYEATPHGDMPDAHQLYDLQHTIMQWQVTPKPEITAYCEIWYKNRKEPSPADHKNMHAILDQAVERFKSLEDDEKELMRGQLTSFRNLYMFLSQIIPYQDSDLEKLYTYLRFLIRKLPRRNDGDGFKLDDEVELKYFRLQKISEGSIDLTDGEADPLKGPTEVGTREERDERVQLSLLVDRLNERFGTDFDKADELFFDQVAEAAISNEKIREAAKVNSLENFNYVFEKMLEGLFIERMEGNEAIFAKIMNDSNFKGVAANYLVREVYNKIRRENEQKE
jgi:type I restriction enzyme R subunit